MNLERNQAFPFVRGQDKEELCSFIAKKTERESLGRESCALPASLLLFLPWLANSYSTLKPINSTSGEASQTHPHWLREVPLLHVPVPEHPAHDSS